MCAGPNTGCELDLWTGMWTHESARRYVTCMGGRAGLVETLWRECPREISASLMASALPAHSEIACLMLRSSCVTIPSTCIQAYWNQLERREQDTCIIWCRKYVPPWAEYRSQCRPGHHRANCTMSLREASALLACLLQEGSGAYVTPSNIFCIPIISR
jgi:hypothetical protein